MANRILDISPEKLTFLGDYSQETSTLLTLKNLSHKSVYFKLRCNEDAKRSRVTPNRGILRPNEHCLVRIVLEPFSSDPTAKGIKFIIEYLQKKDDSVLDTVENVFNGFIGPKPSHLFKCSFYNNNNPFAECNRVQITNVETPLTEVEKLRKENTELRNQVDALKAALAIQSKDSISSTNFAESLEYINIEIPNLINTIEKDIITSFQKLMDKINLKKKSILLEVERARGKHYSDLQTHTNKLSHYKQELTKHSRSISIAKENHELEVHRDVQDFYNSRVLELSQQVIPEPKLYFRIHFPPIQTALDQHIRLEVEN